MWKVGGLFAVAVVCPYLWGWLVFRLIAILWPTEQRQTAPWPVFTGSWSREEFQDYQI